MTSIVKRNTLILLGLVMIVTIMIAASLTQLELQPGMPLPRLENGQVMAAPVEKQELVAVSIDKFFMVFFLLLLAGLMFFSIYKLIKGEDWKKLLSFIPPALFLGLFVVALIFLIMLLPKSSDYVPMNLPLPTPTPPVSAPLGPVPPLLTWIVGFILVVSAILIGIWIFFSSSRQAATTLDVVGLEAEKAWQALKNGQDLKVVITQCYRQMSLVLEKDQGIERKDFMTTGEFERLLEADGVPREPVHQLTRLFEAVRYGNWQPNLADDQDAIQSLEAIVLFSREAKRPD